MSTEYNYWTFGGELGILHIHCGYDNGANRYNLPYKIDLEGRCKMCDEQIPWEMLENLRNFYD